MELIDTHCHLTFAQFEKNLELFSGFHVYNSSAAIIVSTQGERI